MWSYALLLKNTYQRGEHTRKSFTLSVWAGLTDVCWTPWVICFLQFLSLSFTLIRSLTLSPFRLILAMCELWHLPTWEQLEKNWSLAFQMLWFTATSAGKIAKQHSRNMSCHLGKTWWHSNGGANDCLAGLILSSFTGYVFDIIESSSFSGARWGKKE